MNERIRHCVRISIPFMIIMALSLSAALPVLADNISKPVASVRLVQGEVASVSSDNSTIVVRNGNHGQVTINVDANTKYFILPREKSAAAIAGAVNAVSVNQKLNKLQFGRPQIAAVQESQIDVSCKADMNAADRLGKPAKFSDVQVGDRIIAEVKTADNLALRVIIIKIQAIQKVSGNISAVSDSSITITPSDGTAVTLSWDANTRFVLRGLIAVQSGQYASAVYNRSTMLAQTVEVQATAPTKTASLAK